MTESILKSTQIEVQPTTELKNVLAMLKKHGHEDQTLAQWLAEEIAYALKRNDTVNHFRETVQRVLTNFGLGSVGELEGELCNYYYRESLSPHERKRVVEQQTLRRDITRVFYSHGIANTWLADWVAELAEHNRTLPTTGTVENFRARVMEILKASNVSLPALVDDLVAVYEGRKVVPAADAHNAQQKSDPATLRQETTVRPFPSKALVSSPASAKEQPIESAEVVADPDTAFRTMVNQQIHVVLERFGRPNRELTKWLAEEVETAQEKKYTREQFQITVARVLEYFNLHKNNRLITALTECYLNIPAKDGYEPPKPEVVPAEPMPAELAGRAAEFVGLLFAFLNVRNSVFEAHFRELYVELLTRDGVTATYMQQRLKNICAMHGYGKEVLIEEAIRFMQGSPRFQESAVTTLRGERDKKAAKEQMRAEHKDQIVQRLLRPVRRLFNGRLST